MPTTNPVRTQQIGNPFRTEQREITIIRGGVESRVILEHHQPENLITGVEIDSLDLNK